jgi:adenylate kinase family enzyme
VLLGARGSGKGACAGEHLCQRTDDAPETVRARLTTFTGKASPSSTTIGCSIC